MFFSFFHHIECFIFLCIQTSQYLFSYSFGHFYVSLLREIPILAFFSLSIMVSVIHTYTLIYLELIWLHVRKGFFYFFLLNDYSAFLNQYHAMLSNNLKSIFFIHYFYIGLFELLKRLVFFMSSGCMPFLLQSVYMTYF